jgi:hypothetical protein
MEGHSHEPVGSFARTSNRPNFQAPYPVLSTIVLIRAEVAMATLEQDEEYGSDLHSPARLGLVWPIQMETGQKHMFTHLCRKETYLFQLLT